MATKETSVALKNYDISKVSDVEKMTRVLRSQIVKHGLFTKIGGHNYVHVDGWEFAGGMLGILPRVVEVQDISKGDEVKWRAEVEIVDAAGRVVSRGFALCSDKESRKKNFDEYAVLSMAQTRAIGKAYRNALAWIMKLAGYEGTPSEEVDEKSAAADQSAGAGESPRRQFDEAVRRLVAVKTVAGLKSVWMSLTATQRADDEVLAVKNEIKKKLS